MRKQLPYHLKGIQHFQELGIGGYNFKMDLQRIGCGLDSYGSEDESVSSTWEVDNKVSGSIKGNKTLSIWATMSFSVRTFHARTKFITRVIFPSRLTQIVCC
jgi:hypothetical protein